MTLLSPKTGSWRARSNVRGKRSYVPSRLSSRSMRAGVRKSRSVIGAAERAELSRGSGENLPQIWHAATTSAADRKRILRFIVREVVLDQRRSARSSMAKDCLANRRRPASIACNGEFTPIATTSMLIGCANGSRSSMPPARWTRRSRRSLNQEGFVAARGCAFKGENVWLLRTRWNIPDHQNQWASSQPDPRWPDGSFSIQGAAASLGITSQTVFDLSRSWAFGLAIS